MPVLVLLRVQASDHLFAYKSVEGIGSRSFVEGHIILALVHFILEF